MRQSLSPRLALALAFCLAGSAALAAPSFPTPPRSAAILQADAHLGDVADDADYLFRLGMLEGHLLVGHELLAAHQPGLALPHFGHPVRELYDDISDYLNRRKFPPFDTQLARLEAAVAAAPSSPDTEAKYQAAIETLHKARLIAPEELRGSVPEMIKMCSDVIDAASGEFGESLERGRVTALVEYHDSRGFLEYVDQEIGALAAAHPDQNALFDRFRGVLAKAQWIVGELLPAPTPRASVSTYRSFAAEAAGLAHEAAR